MSEYLQGFLYGRMLAQNPELMRYAIQQQQQELETQRASQLGQILLQSLGSDPTGSAQPAQQDLQSNLPDQQVGNSPYEGQYADLINLAAKKYNFSPQEIADTIRVESGFNPNAQSPTGPQGLMQLSKAAAQDVGLDPNERMDPAKNIEAGTAYAKQLRDEFGDRWRLAYHDGPGAVRNGDISQAGLDYVAKFDKPSDQSIAKEYAIQPKSFQGGSKFQQSGVIGGSGVLGQDMDPVRREYLHTIRQLAETGNPMAVQLASELYQKMQDAHMSDIQRTAMAKDIALTNLVPGSPEFSSLVERAILRPGNQTIINNGQNNRPMVLTPDEQMTYIGKVAKPGEPQPRWTKDSDIKVGAPVGTTEDQGKSSMFATGLNSALSTLFNIASTKDFTPSLENKDFIGSELEKADIPILSAYGTAMQSGQQQEYAAAEREAKTHLVHALSGSGFTEAEDYTKTLAYLPSWGSKPEATRSKLKALSEQLNALVTRAGAAATPELREAAKQAKERAESFKAEPKEAVNKVGLPELPPGFRWED